MQKKKKIISKGTLVFPSKSTHNKDRNVNHEELIKLTEKAFEGPYSICIYYLDLKKDWSIFKRKGWKIYTCGNKHSNKFLYKFYNYVSAHKNIVCTSINTAAFYAMYMKKEFKFILNNPNDRKNKKIVFQNKEDNYLQQATIKYYENKYPGFTKNKLSKLERYELSKNELGFESIKSPEEIYSLIGWNNFFKKVCINYFKYLF